MSLCSSLPFGEAYRYRREAIWNTKIFGERPFFRWGNFVRFFRWPPGPIGWTGQGNFAVENTTERAGVLRALMRQKKMFFLYYTKYFHINQPTLPKPEKRSGSKPYGGIKSPYKIGLFRQPRSVCLAQRARDQIERSAAVVSEIGCSRLPGGIEVPPENGLFRQDRSAIWGKKLA